MHISLRGEPVGLDGSEKKRPLLPFFPFFFFLSFAFMVQEIFLEHRLEAFKSSVCQSLNRDFFLLRILVCTK